MASQSRTIKVRFDGDADGLARATTKGAKSIEKFKDQAAKSGETLAKGFSDGFGDTVTKGLKDAAPKAVGSFGDTFLSGLKGTLSTPMVGPILIAALLGAAAILGPLAAAAISGALVLGLGAGLVGIGAILLLQDEKIRAQFAKTGESIKKTMTDAAKPLLPVFKTAMDAVNSLVKSFAPTIKDAFKDAQGSLKDFAKNAIGALEGLKPAVRPVMQAFTDILNIVGPQLKGIFKDVGAAIADMAKTVSANKTVIAAIFVGLLKSIPLVINGISSLTSFFGTLMSVANQVAVALSDVFASASKVVLGFAEKFLGVLKSVAQAIGKIPGMEEWSKSVVKGIDTAIAKVQGWKQSAIDLGREVKIRANITDLTQKLDKALADLNDPNITKERRAQLNAEITKLQVAKAKAVTELSDPKLVKEYKSSLTSSISELQSRLATARKELADPNLTKERKSKLNADIASLKAQVAAAKSALASIQDKTVRITSIYQTVSGQAALANKVRAKGGPVHAGETYLVGEKGPELLVMKGQNGFVVPNNRMANYLNDRAISTPTTPSTVPTAPHSTGSTTVDVKVFLGDRELTDIVRVEMSERDRSVKRRALAGVAR